MAKKSELDFTKRTIVVLAQEMIEAKRAFDRSFASLKALAKEQGIKLPKPE